MQHLKWSRYFVLVGGYPVFHIYNKNIISGLSAVKLISSVETLVNVKNISSRFFEKVFDENLGTLRETTSTHGAGWPRVRFGIPRKREEREKRLHDLLFLYWHRSYSQRSMT